MYRLYMLDNDHFEIHSNTHGAYEGTMDQIFKYCILTLGISFDELHTSVLEMNKLDHNGAEFGVLGTFIFSFQNSSKNIDNIAV